MLSLPQRIMEYAERLPEATPLCPGGLLHLGKRAAVDQALSRLARRGKLMRICYGVYMRPVETRFGRCGPSIGRALQALSTLWGGDLRAVRRRGRELAGVDDSKPHTGGLSDFVP